MEAFQEQHRDYQRIAQTIEFLNHHPNASLEECAQQLHLSPQHFQKLFSRWAGVSPKKYTRFLQKEYARKCLHHSASLIETSEQSQLSSTGRLYDLFIQFYSMTPAQYREQGKHLKIFYGFHPSPFGLCLIANTELGLCKLAFYDEAQDRKKLLSELKQEWSLASFEENQHETEKLLQEVFRTKYQTAETAPLQLLLKGTPFQLHIWEALLRIPEGGLVSYGEVAKAIGNTHATRAVSSAIAKNNIALLIPCHRVIRQNGMFHQYRWGSTRKQALLAWEASQIHHEDD